MVVLGCRAGGWHEVNPVPQLSWHGWPQQGGPGAPFPLGVHGGIGGGNPYGGPPGGFVGFAAQGAPIFEGWGAHTDFGSHGGGDHSSVVGYGGGPPTGQQPVVPAPTTPTYPSFGGGPSHFAGFFEVFDGGEAMVKGASAGVGTTTQALNTMTMVTTHDWADFKGQPTAPHIYGGPTLNMPSMGQICCLGLRGGLGGTTVPLDALSTEERGLPAGARL